MFKFVLFFTCLLLIFPQTSLAAQAESSLRDEFFWIGRINKASVVSNEKSGLLSKSQAVEFAKAINKVLAEGDKPGAIRPGTVISFEPLLIKVSGPEITMLHAGRSSQDIHATFNAAMMREDLLELAQAVNHVSQTLLLLAEQQQNTLVPSYTNGVAAQPTSYGHYLLAYNAGFERDMQRLQQYYLRLNRSPMGTTVLNGTSWPLDRDRMSDYLGFDGLAYNAYDAGQIFSIENPAEAAHVVTSISLHIGSFIEDVMQQYAQPRPWIVLEEGGGNTYASSAMPQKRNPGILNAARTDASTIIGYAMGGIMRAHNIPPGMADPRSKELNLMVKKTTILVNNFNKILKALKIDQDRALEELNLDWTASQEVADLLMRKYKVPFRVGHHFASDMVGYARAHGITPLNFPYSEAKRIYQSAVAGVKGVPAEFPMDEAEFRASLDPKTIVSNRATKGGPQPAEMAIMFSDAKKTHGENEKWVQAKYGKIAAAEHKLDDYFAALLKD